ncbi:MAG TPA: hypothetical protein VNO30_08835 [Kofleriaceae bacterium]|nr:hypothetical protein [Kofleriaceae bacterium]
MKSLANTHSTAGPDSPPPFALRPVTLGCSSCQREQDVQTLDLENIGFCVVCLDRSRSVAVDGELGGEC